MELVHRTTELSVLLARAVSFPAALSATWLLNRHWTFEHGRTRSAQSQYVLYVVGQLGSLAINFSVFAYLVSDVALFSRYPVLALGIGAVVALVFSYLYARLVAFRKVSKAPLPASGPEHD